MSHSSRATEILPTLVQAAKGTCKFDCYADGVLYYRLTWWNDGDICDSMTPRAGELVFPVPVSDSGSGHFGPEMRGINMLRWIRKDIESRKALDEHIDKARAEWDPNIPEAPGRKSTADIHVENCTGCVFCAGPM